MSSGILRRPLEPDARALFPLVSGTAVVDTIRWDGPASFAEFEHRWMQHVTGTIPNGENFFVIADAGGSPVGCCDLRPDADAFRGEVGLWIGLPYQGKGLGTRAIAELCARAFDVLRLTKLEAHVFVGNWSSRRIFEKNGFELEGTIRAAVLKKGRARDEWFLGKVSPRGIAS